MAFPDQLRGRLIVSCQAPPGHPLNHPETLCNIAMSVVQGGAAGLRTNGISVLRALRRQTAVPILAIEKRIVGGETLITPDFAAASALAAAGATVIALDCTARIRPQAESWQILVRRIHEELDLPVLADIATREEALTAVAAGVDAVATTLYGYTPETEGRRDVAWHLIEQLPRELPVPVIAEGHVRSPQEARRCLDLGAYAVVVGAVITRPDQIAVSFVAGMEGEPL